MSKKLRKLVLRLNVYLTIFFIKPYNKYYYYYLDNNMCIYKIQKKFGLPFEKTRYEMVGSKCVIKY